MSIEQPLDQSQAVNKVQKDIKKKYLKSFRKNKKIKIKD